MNPTESSGEGSAEAAFERVSERYRSDPRVTAGTGFGSNPGLRVDGKIFAMIVRGSLVVKLAKSRVDELIASGVGHPFDAGRGRIMREWVSVPDAGDWPGLVDEARQFVGREAGG